MKSVVEDFCAFESSRVWELHNAYFARAGAEAWTTGALPYLATSSPAMARQHARVLVPLVESLIASGAVGGDEDVRILEVGGGIGEFAGQFLRALAEDCGDGGRAIFQRVRYV